MTRAGSNDNSYGFDEEEDFCELPDSEGQGLMKAKWTLWSSRIQWRASGCDNEESSPPSQKG